MLSTTGGVLGLALAAITLRVGVSWLPETLPRINEIGLNWHVVEFAILLAVLTGIVCGLAPAFAALRTSVNEALKEGGRAGTAGGGYARLRSALVVGEIAIALALLVASGLLLRSFEKMRAVDLGFRSDHVLTASYSLPQRQYATQAAVDEFNHELIRRLRQLPGVKFAGLTSFLPASGGNSNTVFDAEGYVAPKSAGMNLATQVTVEGDYLQAIGVSLLSGRYFTPADTADTQLVAIVNHKLAEHCWPGSDPVGKRLRLGLQETKIPWLTVVGEVADVKEASPDVPSKQQYYLPVEQYEKSIGPFASPTDLNGNGGYIAIRTATEPEQIANVLRATVRSIDPQLPLSQVQTMEQAVSDTEAPRRFNTALISAFALVAVLLAALGIYSVIAFSARPSHAGDGNPHCLRLAKVRNSRLSLRISSESGNPRVCDRAVGRDCGFPAAGLFPVWCQSFRSAGAEPGRSFRTAPGRAGFIAARAARSLHRPHERSACRMTLEPGALSMVRREPGVIRPRANIGITSHRTPVRTCKTPLR